MRHVLYGDKTGEKPGSERDRDSEIKRNISNHSLQKLSVHPPCPSIRHGTNQRLHEALSIPRRLQLALPCQFWLYIHRVMQRLTEDKAKKLKGNQSACSPRMSLRQQDDGFLLNRAYSEATPSAARKVAYQDGARKARFSFQLRM